MSDEVHQNEAGNTPNNNIRAEVEMFTQKIDALGNSLPSVMFLVTASVGDSKDRFTRYADKYGTKIEKTEDQVRYSFVPPYDARAAMLNKSLTQSEATIGLIEQVFVLALVSQYDAYLGRLIKSILSLKPELITNSERTLSLSQLLELGTINNAAEYILEKEIEGVLRKSHVEQFSWLENKFSVKLREGLDSWPTFLELTERRNLFAHTNGVVSDQYIAACKSHGVELDSNCIRGTTLNVTPDYYNKAISCVYDIGVKLSQVLWRKLKIEPLEEADNSIITSIYNLIVSERYDLACSLSDFACCTIKNHASEEGRLTMIINRAQAYKWKGDSAKCNSIISSEDWSACGGKFHLVLAVLKDDYEQASKIMLSIGHGGLSETAYQEWPVFKGFRNTEQFSKAYENVYGKPFIHLEKVMKTEEGERRKEVLDKLKKILEGDLIDPDILH